MGKSKEPKNREGGGKRREISVFKTRTAPCGTKTRIPPHQSNQEMVKIYEGLACYPWREGGRLWRCQGSLKGDRARQRQHTYCPARKVRGGGGGTTNSTVNLKKLWEWEKSQLSYEKGGAKRRDNRSEQKSGKRSVEKTTQDHPT